MARVMKTTDLIKSIRRRAMLPKSNNTFSDQDIIDMINEEVLYFAVPHMLSAYEEFLVIYEDFDISSIGTEYVIPYRSVGNKLRDVALIDASGNFYEMSRISVEDINEFQNATTSFLSQYVFYIQDNKIILPNNLTNIGTSIRLYYYLSPNQLVDEANIGTITNINTTTGEISLSNFPDDFSVLSEMDFVSSKSPNKIYSFDKTPTASSSAVKSITFNASDLPSNLEVGDFICKKQESPVLQLPPEFAAVITQRVAVQALEALGDEQGKQSAERRLKQMEDSILMLIQDRVEGAPQKIGNRNSILKNAVGTPFKRNGGY